MGTYEPFEAKNHLVGYFIDGFKNFVWICASQSKDMLNTRPVLINPVHIRYVDGNRISMDNGVNWYLTKKALSVVRNLTSYDVLFEE